MAVIMGTSIAGQRTSARKHASLDDIFLIVFLYGSYRLANIRTMDLNLLAVFDALFDTRSVTKAADRLSLTQPTVSGMLQRLRRMLSDQLFVRTSHGILPTPRAEPLAGPIKELLANAQVLVRAEAFDPASAEGTVRLCGSDYLQHAVMTPLIKELRRRAPRLKVLVAPRPASGVTDLMARGEIDLCFSLPEVADPDLPALLLYRDRYVCVARKGHPLKGHRISTKQVCVFDHLLVDPTGRSLWGPVDTVLAALGERRRVVTAVPSFHILFELLDSGDFLAFVPERLLRGRRSQHRVFETSLDIPALHVTATWHPRVSGDARHKWLRQTLVRLVGDQSTEAKRTAKPGRRASH
jgi:DNA-binding transcriptional LysR family regulator